MKTRVVWSYTAGGIAICVIGAAGAGLWLKNETAPRQAVLGTKAPLTQHERSQSKNARSYLPGLLPSMDSLRLKWSPMGEMVKSHHKSARNTRITRAVVPARLDLQLPATPVIGAQSHATGSALDSNLGDATAPSRTQLVINLNRDMTSRQQRFADDARLFNHSNGLRGFMAHNWLTKTVGLQGGLAIKETRLRDDNSDLRGNMAVGMGVLLAF